MNHVVPVHATITAVETAVHCIDTVFRHHGLLLNIFQTDNRFTFAFSMSLFEYIGTKPHLATAAYPETTGQNERETGP